MTQQDILRALGRVQEPDLGKDLVSLNMIRDIDIQGRNVAFTLVLTTPACPLKELMRRECEAAIRQDMGETADRAIVAIVDDHDWLAMAEARMCCADRAFWRSDMSYGRWMAAAEAQRREPTTSR